LAAGRVAFILVCAADENRQAGIGATFIETTENPITKKTITENR
jgi:Tfp pilus assembly protein PilZ